MVIVSSKSWLTVNYNALRSSSKSKKQNLWGRIWDLPIFFRYKPRTSLKNHRLAAQSESLPYSFRATFAAEFVLIYRLRESPLSAIPNRLELRCQVKQLLLLYYKICLCYLQYLVLITIPTTMLRYNRDDATATDSKSCVYPETILWERTATVTRNYCSVNTTPAVTA